MKWDQDKYNIALNFAATAHGAQKVPGTPYSYVVHITEVAQEVMAAVFDADKTGVVLDADLAIQCALMHDVIEDTQVTYDEIARYFGEKVAAGVLALSKDAGLPKDRQLRDSLERIRQQPREVWMVKMADRIVNLQPAPSYWTVAKKELYREDARIILTELKEADLFLAERLRSKIDQYCI